MTYLTCNLHDTWHWRSLLGPLSWCPIFKSITETNVKIEHPYISSTSVVWEDSSKVTPAITDGQHTLLLQFPTSYPQCLQLKFLASDLTTGLTAFRHASSINFRRRAIFRAASEPSSEPPLHDNNSCNSGGLKCKLHCPSTLHHSARIVRYTGRLRWSESSGTTFAMFISWQNAKIRQVYWSIRLLVHASVCLAVRSWCVSYFDGLMQERRNSIANALKLRLFCTNPSICLNSKTFPDVD